MKRCKSMAAATVNKQRSRTLSGLGRILTTRRRDALTKRQFCLPSQRKYPVQNCSHARNALARASAAYREGYLSPYQYKKVRACANRAKRRLCR